jgi:hypothetical protein
MNQDGNKKLQRPTTLMVEKDRFEFCVAPPREKNKINYSDCPFPSYENPGPRVKFDKDFKPAKQNNVNEKVEKI